MNIYTMFQQWYRRNVHNLTDNHEVDLDLLDDSLHMVTASAIEVCREAVNAVQVIANKFDCKSENTE